MPVGYEDKTPLSITGDPAPTTPRSQKQVAGDQKAQANRTMAHPVGGEKPPNGQPAQKERPGSQTAGDIPERSAQSKSEADANTQFMETQGGALAKVPADLQSEADAAIGLNPAHGQDWWKHALEAPVETYFLGKHLYNAYYGAFLDSNAIQTSVHDIWHQDNAVGWLLRHEPMGPGNKLTGISPENFTAGAAGMALPMGADPMNLLFAGPMGRGAALVARFLVPGAVAAIFNDKHSPSDLAWAVIPAMLFGGKGKWVAPVVREMPGFTKLADRISATKLAQDASKSAQQTGEDLYQKILRTGALGPKNETLAPAWSAAEKPLTTAQENQLISTLRERYGNKILKPTGEFVLPGSSKELLQALSDGEILKTDMLDQYGTLDPEKLIPLLVRDGASSTQLRAVWTKLARMHYDLPSIAEGEGPMVDPMSHTPMLPALARQEVENGHQWVKDAIMQAYVQPTSHALDPIVSNLRSMIGIDRNTESVMQNTIAHLRAVVGKLADDPREWDLFSSSIEASGREAEVAYQTLSPEWKYVRDSVRMIAAAAGMANQDLGLIQRIHGYLPRIGLLIKDAKGFRGLRPRSLITVVPTAHRAQAVRFVDVLSQDALQGEQRMVVEQAYKTTKEAQQAVERQRQNISEAIINRTSWDQVLRETGAGVPATDIKEIEQIQADIERYPDIAKMEAEAYAKRLVPDFSENPWNAIYKFGSQIRAATSARAMQDLMNATLKDGKSVAIPKPRDSRAVEKAAKDGYTSMTLPGMGSAMVHADYAKLLTQMAHLNSTKPEGWFKKVVELEGTAVTMIMFAPRIHGINMAGRLAIAMSRFGPDIKEYMQAGMLQKGGGTSLPPMIPGVKGFEGVQADPYRTYPRNAGVIPYMPAKGMAGSGFAEKAIQSLGDMVNDTDMGRVPIIQSMADSTAVQKASSTAQDVLGKVGQAGEHIWGKQSELWSWVSDFGVMMFWVEKAAAMRSGRFDAAARKAMEAAGTEFSAAEHAKQTEAMVDRYAAARANSWMGHVAPEDTNPWLHAALKSAFFAPNYWRTWAEILTGYYRNAGFGWSHDTIRYVVENEIKTAAAAVLFQQLSANALNLAFSGHSIYQNDPGNWGKVEITNPWAIAAYNEYVRMTLPKDKQAAALIDEKTGRDGKGAKLTWENPLARQTTDTEQAMGFLTSSPHWGADTFAQGFSSFAAARVSPVASAAAALANIDLYRSISSDGLRYIDPNHDTIGDPQARLADLITAGGDLTPFSGIGSNIQSQIMQGNVQDVKGPFGLPIPQAVLDAFSPQSLLGDAGKALLAGMTGTNPPHMRSSKTAGVSPTDDQYKNVHEDQITYQNQMNAASTAALSGQMPPYQWLAAYRAMSAKHAIQMQNDFKHAPEYNYGPLGLTNSYESLYDQATDQYGVLDPDKLRSLQHQWRQDHSAGDYTAVQNELRVNDQKYPMLQLYHKTQDAYYNWQADWCKQNGVDLATLQSDMSGWSKVYNDRTASAQWVRDHPEITQFENAKKHEFESGDSTYGMAGLMYALFFNPTAADRYLNSSGETAQQVEQDVQKEQIPAAP
jgi:hypothetical protein